MIHFDKLRTSLRSVTVPYTFVVLLCLLLSSCGLVPNATDSQSTQQQQAMPNLQPVNFKTTADEQTPTMPPVQIITFPDMVTPQTLAAVDKLPGGQHFKLKLVVAKKSSSQQDAELDAVEADEADDNEDKDDAEEGDDEDDAFSVQAQKSKPKYTKKDRVFIPETGTFNLTFQAGSDYQVLDGDARDGNATVQMPREVLAAYMKVRGKFSRDAHKQFPAITRKLSYADPLYYVKQDLTREKKRHGKQTWLSLGNRALPILTDWRSADGDKYILKLNNQGVTRVVMRWYPTKGNAVVTYPPGLNLIGPAGGVVQLPGVGKLEIPAGAIATPTVVRMSQVLQAKSLEQVIHPDNSEVMLQDAYDFVSPIIKLEPFLLQLNKPASLQLPVDPQKTAGRHPGSLEFACSADLAPSTWSSWHWQGCVTSPPFGSAENYIQNFRYDTPMLVHRLAHITKMHPRRASHSSEFHIQQTAEASETYITSKYFATQGDTDDESLFRPALQRLDIFYEYYSSLGIKEPQKIYPLNDTDSPENKKKVLVKLNLEPNQGGRVQIFTRPDANKPSKSRFIGKALIVDISDGFTSMYFNQAAAHELFHIFQTAYINGEAAITYVTREFTDRWFDEGVASYMEGRAVSQKAKVLEIAFDPNLSFYKVILNASQTVFPMSIPKRTTAPIPGHRGQQSYTSVALFGHAAISNQHEQTIANIVIAAGQEIEQNKKPDVLAKMNASISAGLSNEYESYVKNAYLKEHLNIFASPYTLGDFAKPPKIINIVTAEHHSETPLSLTRTIQYLGAEHHLITPDDNLPSNVTLTVKFTHINPVVLTDLPDSPSGDFYLRPSVLKLDANGEPIANAEFIPIPKGDTGISIPNFNSEQVSGVVLAIPNTLWEAEQPLGGTFEISYDAPLKLNSLDPNPQETQQTLTLKGVGFDTKTPANNKVVFTTLSSTHELPASGVVDDTDGQQRLTVTIPSDAVTGDISIKVRNQETNALFLKVKPHIESLTPNNVYKGESKTISVKGSGLAARGQVPIGVSFGSTGAGNLQVINSNELTVTVPGTLNDGIFKVKASVDNLLSNEVDFEVLPLKPVAEFVGVDKNPLFANGLEETSIRYKLKGVAPGKTVRLKIQIKPKLGSSGNLFCNACGGYIASTSSYDQIQAAGDITIKYKAPNTNINPTDYLGTQDGTLWKDPRYGNEIDIFFLNTNNEFVKISPNNSDGVDTKVYWNWTATGTLNYPSTIIADNQWVDFAISDVRDKAGRLVPDGTYVYLTDPYYGEFDLSQGTNADNGPAIRLTGGAGKVRYRHNEPFGWGYDPNLAPGLQQGIQQCLRFQAVRTSNHDNTYAIQPPKDECFYTYRPPQ